MKKDTKQIILEMGEWQRLRRIENAANWCVGWLSAGDLPDDVAMLTRLVEALEDNADLTGNQKLGKRCRISEKIRKACRCIGLLNSMVRGGERHSDTSSRMVVEALDALDYLEQHPLASAGSVADPLHVIVGAARPQQIHTKLRAKDTDDMEKTLHNSDVSGARKNVPDIKVVGNGDMFRLLCKASSENEGWMKSTKAMEVVGGCVVQVTTQQKNIDGTYSVAEALTYVPGVKIADDGNNGRKLVPIG